MMIGWMDFVNLSIGIAGLTMTMLGLLVTLIYRPVDHVMRQYFLLFFSLLIVYTGSIFVGQIVDYLENPRLVLQGSVFLESLSSSLLMPLLTALPRFTPSTARAYINGAPGIPCCWCCPP